MKDQMTKKERILAAIGHKECDRLPTDIWAVPETIEKLKAHFNTDNVFKVYDELGLDKIINIGPKYKGPRQNYWGIEFKDIKTATGTYQEPTFQPIAAYNTIDDIEANYIWPSVEWFDYSVIEETSRKLGNDYALESGYLSLTYFYDQLRGTENMLTDFITEPELAEYILSKIQDFTYEHTKRILEAGNGRIDISQVTDDFGSQHSLLMSPAMIKHYLEGYYKKNIALVKSYNSKVFHHDDGAIAELIPWLKELGVEVLNPIQWHLPGWNLDEIKALHGDKICFHGAIDNQDVLPFGTIADVESEVRHCVDALFGNKTGYILAPCHNIQSNTPIENIIAMYKTAHEF